MSVIKLMCESLWQSADVWTVAVVLGIPAISKISDDAAPQPQASAALPVADADAGRSGFPILFLLLFVYVFGGQLGAGLGAVGTHPDRHAYLTYVVPGILIMTVASAALGTAISIGPKALSTGSAPWPSPAVPC